MGFHCGSVLKNLPAMQKMWVQSLGWEDPLERNGYPLQYSCLGNPLDRGAWQAIVHGVARVRHDLVTKSPGKIYTKHRDERLLSAE